METANGMLDAYWVQNQAPLCLTCLLCTVAVARWAQC